MKAKTLIIIALFLSAAPFSGNAIYLNVNIFYKQGIKKIEFSVFSGRYSVSVDGKKVQAAVKGEKCEFIAKGDSVEYLKNGKKIGTYSQIKILGTSFINVFTIKPLSPDLKSRNYDDHLFIESNKGQLNLLNNVDLEHYVAGVVQSESGGSNDNIEYFFVQAIISRTYALVNYLKHKDEGFNLCDGVHCQYYLGRCRNSDIARAVARTSGDVIVDKDNRMISAAFHSNCGGQTVNSEDVWSIPTSYLKSVNDTFCMHESNAKWEKRMSKKEWLAFLEKQYHYPVNDTSMANKAIHFNQKRRKINFYGDIPLKFIRQDLGLRSTFFSIEPLGEDSILISGRGYGHGVGLCQQGAINMVKTGFDYKEVIKHYYTGVKIIHYSELKYNFMP